MNGKPLFSSRLFWIGLLTFVIAGLSALAGGPLADHPQLVLWLGAAQGLLVSVLRVLTTKPIDSITNREQ